MTGVLLVAADKPLAPGELTTGESAQLAGLRGEPAQRSWLTARGALRRALAACGHAADTCAHRFPNRVVSVSHSAELAVVAVLPEGSESVVGIGVDLELDRDPDIRIAPFFLTHEEQDWFDALPETRRPTELLRLWTVKEALFKADPDNANTALRDYAIPSPAAQRGRAARTPGGTEFRYTSFTLARGVLSLALGLSPSWRRKQMRTVDFDCVARQISSLISVPTDRLIPEVMITELLPDSFAFVEVAVDLQEEFDVVLRHEDLRDLHTLGDLVTLLRSRVEQRISSS